MAKTTTGNQLYEVAPVVYDKGIDPHALLQNQAQMRLQANEAERARKQQAAADAWATLDKLESDGISISNISIKTEKNLQVYIPIC